MTSNANLEMTRRGVMLALSSPSGAGKTTISRRLMEEDKNISISISATTRDKRDGETEGQHYYFVNQGRFEAMIDNDELLEYAQVYGKMYGTPKAPVDEALNAGRDVLFDIDWQGTRSLSKKMPDDIVSIFILPPSWEELERRLTSRGQDSTDEIKRRMAKAVDEISHYEEYHYVIINHDLDDSLHRVRAILEAERMKRRRISGLKTFVSGLKPTV